MQTDFINKLLGCNFGDSNAISIDTNYFTDIDLYDTIPANFFYPKPKVESGIMKLTCRKKRQLKKAEEPEFINFIKNTYRYPNKSVSKALNIMKLKPHTLKIGKELMETKLKELTVEDALDIFSSL